MRSGSPEPTTLFGQRRSPRLLNLVGLVLFLSSFSWIETGSFGLRSVETYAREGVGGLQIAYRVIPVLASLSVLGLIDLAERRNAWMKILSWPGVTLAWYSVVGVASGLEGPLPYLAAWKGVEILTVTYWAAHILRIGETDRVLRWMLGILTIYLVYVSASVFYFGSEVARPAYGPIPIWLAGKFPPANPNTLGVYAAICVWSLAAKAVKPRTRALRVAAWVSCLFVLIAAQSRTAFLAIVAVTFLNTAAGIVRPGRRDGTLRIAIVALLFPMTLVMADQLASVFARGQDVEEILTLSGRTEFWRTAKGAVMAHPVTGAGHATGSRYLYLSNPEVFSAKGVNIHNAALEALTAAGLLGAGPLMVAILLMGLEPFKKVFVRHQLRLGYAAGLGLILLFRGITSIAPALFSMDLLLLALVLNLLLGTGKRGTGE